MYRGIPGEGAPESAWEDESRWEGKDQGTSPVAQTGSQDHEVSCGRCLVHAHVDKFTVVAVELAVRGVKAEDGATSEIIASARI